MTMGFLKELGAVANDEIPLGGETTLCLNVINDLGQVGWGDIAIRKFLGFVQYLAS